MAIGLGRIFGFRFNENFDYPYCAASVTEFWRRWHMSLTTWFRDYLYIPLGGNRGGTAKTMRNLLIVWFCTGFWHGASWNFVLWGLYFAAWLILEKYVLRGVLEQTPAVGQAPLHPHRGVCGLGPLRHGGPGRVRGLSCRLLRRRAALERGGPASGCGATP